MLSILAVLLTTTSFAQNIPLNEWRVQVPYQSAVDLVVVDDKVWAGLEASVMRVDREDFSITRLTKATGLSDVEVAKLDYDAMTNTVIVTYENANIDLIKGNSIVNIPFLKDALITGDKTINSIYTHNGFAWLATGFGIVKVDLENEEIDDTYFIGVGNSNLQVNDVWANDGFVFAATEDGVLRGTISPFINLSNADDPNAWLRYDFENNQIPEVETDVVDAIGTTVYAFQDEEVFALTGSLTWTATTEFTGWETISSRNKGGEILLTQFQFSGEDIVDARIGAFNGTMASFESDNGQVQRPFAIDRDADGVLWYAEFFAGLTRVEGSTYNRFVPNGPFKRSLFDMTYYDGSMYVASADIDPTLPADYSFLPNGIYRSTNQQWTNYNEFNVPGLAGFADISVIEPIPAENKLLIGAHLTGLLEFDLDDNSVTSMITPPGESNPYRTIAMATDAGGNIWMTNAGANQTPLICRKADGTYLYFDQKTQGILNEPLNTIAIDASGQVWIGTAGDGAYVYNINGTLDDQSDDILKPIGTNFGLPAADVRAIISEDDGEVWIGTAAGIGVVFCPGSIINNNCIVDRICIPRQDTTNFCDNLLENELITAIATDPSNRKWIGTRNGIFLQSEDGLETIHYFTEDNSPLLSNSIRSIAVDEDNGDVYIGTDKGLITFRGDATFTDEDDTEEVYVYPNPVRPKYRGPIAIRNLPNNANVKIADVAGHVVYETISEGGQATWDGRDPNGKRVHSGVYIVLSANDDGSFKRSAKFVFIR